MQSNEAVHEYIITMQKLRERSARKADLYLCLIKLSDESEQTDT